MKAAAAVSEVVTEKEATKKPKAKAVVTKSKTMASNTKSYRNGDDEDSDEIGDDYLFSRRYGTIISTKEGTGS